MPFTKSMLMASALALASSVGAHMKMLTPIPFGNSTLNNSPLDATGSDFPCKQRPGVYEVEGAKNPPMAIGAPQTLTFLGGATHGGGSCQISLTADQAPTKNTKWQVIHSILGDCPSDFDGNQGESASDMGATKFQYTVPQGIKPGPYVLAWTWFNRIGNREMYMNCAPVNITAGSAVGTTNRTVSFPDMFKANIANGCATAYGGNVIFPDPGSSVDKRPTFPSINPVGACDTGKSASTNNTENTGSSNSSAHTPVPASNSSFPSNSSSPNPSHTPHTPLPAAGLNATHNTTTTIHNSCTAPGQSICSPDGKMIGTCDATKHVAFIHVAEGTVCKDGYMVMAGCKRSARFVVNGTVKSYPVGKC